MVSLPAIPSTDQTCALPSSLTVACPARQVKAYRINGFVHALEWLLPKGGRWHGGTRRGNTPVPGTPQVDALGSLLDLALHARTRAARDRDARRARQAGQARRAKRGRLDGTLRVSIHTYFHSIPSQARACGGFDCGRRARAFRFSIPLFKGVAEVTLYCAHRATTFL